MPEAAETSTPRQRRRQRVRRELSEAALTLFADKGYAATTVEEIAAAVDYSASTFHRHFARKEDAAFHEIPRWAEEMSQLAQRHVTSDPWSVMREALVRFAVEWDEQPGLGPSSARLFLTVPELRARWLEITEDLADIVGRFLAREYGRPEPDLLCSVAGKSLLLAGRSAMEVHTVRGGRLVDHLEEALRVVEAGLGAELAAARASVRKARRRTP